MGQIMDVVDGGGRDWKMRCAKKAGNFGALRVRARGGRADAMEIGAPHPRPPARREFEDVFPVGRGWWMGGGGGGDSHGRNRRIRHIQMQSAHTALRRYLQPGPKAGIDRQPSTQLGHPIAADSESSREAWAVFPDANNGVVITKGLNGHIKYLFANQDTRSRAVEFLRPRKATG